MILSGSAGQLILDKESHHRALEDAMCLQRNAARGVHVKQPRPARTSIAYPPCDTAVAPKPEQLVQAQVLICPKASFAALPLERAEKERAHGKLLRNTK